MHDSRRFAPPARLRPRRHHTQGDDDRRRGLTTARSAGPDDDASAAHRALLVFARAPEPGRVKTRLAAELGDERALEIYRELGARTVRAVERVPRCTVTVLFTPAGAEPRMREWLGDVALRPQCDGDLGARLAAAVGDAFARGARQVAVVGTDCPDVDAAVVERAFARLDEGADVVLGPADDGGYYLIALARPHPAPFADIPWSTERTLAATVGACERAGLRIALIETLHDVDTAADWRRWVARQPASPGRAALSGR